MENEIFYFFTAQLSYDWAALFLRVAIGIALLPYGIAKIITRREAAAKFPRVLFFTPQAGFYLAMLIETIAPLCMIFGLLTRLACIPAIINMGIASNVSRGKYFTSPAQSFLLGFIAILLVGPGGYSLDCLIFYSGL